MTYSPRPVDFAPVAENVLCNTYSPCFPSSGAITIVPSAAVTWPTINMAFFYPFIAPFDLTVFQLGVSLGSAISGNFDVGVYDAAFARLVSSGTTAHSGTSGHPQWVDVADTALTGGTLYYLTQSQDSTTASQAGGSNIGTAPLQAAVGVLQRASSFVLPANATSPSPVAQTASTLFFGTLLAFRSTVP